MRLPAMVLALACISGCGLLFDADPSATGDGAVDRRDASGRGTDGGRADATLGVDGGVLDDAGAADGAPVDGWGGGDASVDCPVPCGLRPQCGCPAAEQCVFDPSVGRTCGAGGAGTEGALCDTQLDCSAGLICALVDASRPSVCTASCTTDGDCGAGRLCVPRVDPAGMPFVPDIGACSFVCNPATGSGCPSPLVCSAGRIRTRSDLWVGICRVVGTGNVDDTCSQPSDCRTGLLCATTVMGTRCQEVCDTRAPVCDGGRSCYVLTPPMLIGGIEFGLCF